MPISLYLPAKAPRSRGDARVEAELRRRIRAQGRITFAEFMETALYLPQGGYYEKHVGIGRAGDFLTSPEVHPVFGALLARLVFLMWHALGAPRPFAIVEYGAGTGALCRQILTSAPQIDAGFASALRYEIVERSAFLRAQQEENLAGAPGRVNWVDPGDPVDPAVGCVLSNEVVDALPVHRVLIGAEGTRELYVGLAADRYLELRGPLSQPGISEYLSAAQVRPAAGSVVEVNLAARDWLSDVSRRLAHGYAVTVDFGGEANELLGTATPRGGLKCFYRHGWSDDPFDRPGLQDITAPVDFTFLRRFGAEVGLATQAQMTQCDLLTSLGVRSVLSRIEASDLRADARQLNLSAIEALAAPGALGGHRVLIQSRDAPDFALDEQTEPGEFPLPLLRKRDEAWPQ
jgi:SAM-dependent MidA family methyltransferase